MSFPRASHLVAGAFLLAPILSVQAQEKPAAPKPAKSAAKKPRVVVLEMAEGLRFSPPRFEAKPGELLSIELENADPSHQPHNFLLVQPGRVQEIVKLAMDMGADGPNAGFVPSHPAILVSSGKTVDPEGKLKLEFTVPTEPGVYGYVCTVPGHGMLMYGALYVGVIMPPLAKDPNIPQLTLEKGLAGGGRRPFVQRMFLPDSGPASIAVALPGTENYCFDAGSCRLRYVWSGPFLDGSAHWRGNGKELAELGDAPWWTSSAFPLVLTESRQGGPVEAAEPKFLGYSLEAGNPEFHFKLGGQEVFQTVQAVNGALELRFRLPGRKASVGFVFEQGEESLWSCPSGTKRKGGGFDIPASKAQEFSVFLKGKDIVAAAPSPVQPAAPAAPSHAGAAHGAHSHAGLSPSGGVAGSLAAASPAQSKKAPKPESRQDRKDESMRGFYKVTQVKGPQGLDAQVGALAALPDGRMAVAFHRGEIGVYSPESKAWNIFAEGLHEPLGILPEADGSFLVMQRAELTRLSDSKGSGKADRYETVWDGFGMTGNYHEFAFGPVRQASGKLLVSLNLASSGDTVFKEVRGQWLPVGLDRTEFYGDWKKNSKLAGRMYSRVPWRGWVMEVDPKTGEAIPYASGFRSPDGLGFDADGRLLVSDNQGDWRGTSELFVVQKDGFYGHPASLPWRAGWGSQAPLEVPVETLDKLRTPAAVWFPHMSYANSPTQMVRIPEGPAWGAFAGQIVIGEMNVPKLLRVTLEQVGGTWQGACYPFIECSDLEKGLHRLAFAGDKLWLGRTHLSWAGGEQLAYVEPAGKQPFDALEIKAAKGGFVVRFTKPLDPAAADAKLWNIRRYSFAYHADYGSPELEQEWITPVAVKVSGDGRSAELQLAELHENFVYDFYFDRLRSASSEEVLNDRAAYTLRKKL
jgi:glucose/arabinose dehydrogenase/plastocyanin